MTSQINENILLSFFPANIYNNQLQSDGEEQKDENCEDSETIGGKRNRSSLDNGGGRMRSMMQGEQPSNSNI